MRFFALYHHKGGFVEIDEGELFSLLSELDLITPAILRLYSGKTVETSEAQIYGLVI